MKEDRTKPEEIFNNYIVEKISKVEALDNLLILLENDDSPSIRSESLEIIQRIGLKDNRLFNIVESSLISDNDPFVRAVALNILCQNFPERSENIFLWLAQNETSAIVLMPLLKYMKKISNEKYIEYKNKIFMNYASIYGVVIDEAEFFLEWEYFYSKNNEDGKYVEIGWFLEEKTNFIYFVKHGEGSNFRSFAVKEHHVIALNFVHQSLRKVPETIQTLKYLKYLNIHGVKEIPDFLEENQNLRELYISGPFVKEMPDWLLLRIKKKYIFPYIVEGVNYENAIVLGLFEYFIEKKLIKIPFDYDIKDKDYEYEYKINENGDVIGIYVHRGIGILPVEIQTLKSLKELKLSGASLEFIPDSIGELTSLRHLELNFGNIKRIPKSLCNLTSLKYLNLSQNKIKRLPKCIYKLKSLKYLNLGSNQLSEISDIICNINSLEELILDDNEIKEIPESITRLKNLKSLYLHQNPIVIFPDVVKEFVSYLDEFYYDDISY